FQAEDGIRDLTVTGVQTCALPIYGSDLNPVAVLITKALVEIPPKFAGHPPVHPDAGSTLGAEDWTGARGFANDIRYYGARVRARSEERRVGKECRARGWAED